MTDEQYRSIVEVIAESGEASPLPDGLEAAVKFTSPEFTTHGGFDWFRGRGVWVESEGPFDPATCRAGGLHVASTMAAAQSGGHRATHCLWVGVDPAEAGPWDGGKRKAPRVFVAGPVDLIGVIRRHGQRAYLRGADLQGADLWGADLQGANLQGANLQRADLQRADLQGADLQGAYLQGAYLRGAYLRRAYLRGADLWGADLWGAYLRGADLWGANLQGAYLQGADLRGAYGRDDWDALVARGAVR